MVFWVTLLTLADVDLTATAAPTQIEPPRLFHVAHEPRAFNVDDSGLFLEGHKLQLTNTTPIVGWLSLSVGAELTEALSFDVDAALAPAMLVSSAVEIEDGRGFFASFGPAWEDPHRDPLAMRLDASIGFRTDAIEVALGVESMTSASGQAELSATLQF